MEARNMNRKIKAALLGISIVCSLEHIMPAYAQKPVALRLERTENPLTVGDRVRLTVAGFPELSGEQLVLDKGTINLPFTGELQIEGLTLSEAIDQITSSLRPYIRYPQVGLSLLSRRPSRVSVTGEVRRPGPRLLSEKSGDLPSQSGESKTLSSVLLLAGGITPNADLRNIIVRRPKLVRVAASSAALSTTKQEFHIDLWKAVSEGDLSADPQIFDGDEIVVPSTPLDASQQKILMASTVAPEKITINVVGQVKNPGSLSIAPGSGATGAVAAAGGPTDKADTNDIAWLRLRANGSIERKTIAFGQPSEPLMDGDVLVVSKSSTSTFIDLAGGILSPLAPLFFLFNKSN
jgi:polysaccharide biosynthesis/export protein